MAPVSLCLVAAFVVCLLIGFCLPSLSSITRKLPLPLYIPRGTPSPRGSISFHPRVILDAKSKAWGLLVATGVVFILGPLRRWNKGGLEKWLGG